MTDPNWSLFFGILAILAGLLAAVHPILGDDKLKRWLAVAGVVILVVSVGAKTCLEMRALDKAASMIRFEEEKLKELEEASGAAFLDGRLYVVDDEESSLFELDVAAPVARLKGTYPFSLCKGGTVIPPITEENVQKATELESITAYGNTLLVLSSHAPKKDEPLSNRRALLMQLRFDQPGGTPCVWIATTLRSVIQEFPDPTTVNIEGLTIIGETMYVGFRSPRPGYALVRSMPVADALAGKVTNPRKYQLPLRDGKNEYAVTALETDGEDILVLGNSTDKDKIFDPRLWRWKPSNGDQYETNVKPLPWRYGLFDYANAKAEGIALGPHDAWVVLDAPRWGGVRRFPRSAIQ